LAHGRFLWVEWGGPYPREVVEELAGRGYVVTGPAWREFGGVPPGEGVPIVVEHSSASVNPLWLAWRTYDMKYIPSEGLLVVEFGGPYGLEDVVVQAVLADRLAGSAAPYIEALMESPRALAMALAEAAKRREVEEAAEALARLGAAEELARAIEAAAAQASAESASTDSTSPTPFPAQAAGESGVEEAAGGQQADASSGIEQVGQISEGKTTEAPLGELMEGAASTQPTEVVAPHVSAGEAPGGLEHIGKELAEKATASVDRPMAEAAGAATESGREPHVEAAVRELAHKLYSWALTLSRRCWPPTWRSTAERPSTPW